MRRAAVYVIACALLCLSGVAEAQIVSPFHLLPVVAKVSGAAGTDWMTSVNISNVSSGGVSVTATFYREDTNNTSLAGASNTFNMAAGQTMSVNHVLGSWFPGQGNTKGILMLMAEPVGGGDGEIAFGQNDWTASVFDCDVDPGDPCLKSAIGLA